MRESVPLLGAFLLAGAAAALEYADVASSKAKEMPDLSQIDDLVAANRILSDQGVVDGFGHVSARHQEEATRFLLARSMAPGLVTGDDIMRFDLDGNALDPRGRTLYVERFIHSEIYKAHPEVKAIVHSHSPSIIPFGVTSVPLRPIYHMSSFLGAGVPIFEIRETGGPATDMLIRTPELGAALARSIGTSAVVLMRGHGDVVVGASVEQVVFRAIYTEINAKLQAEALRLGEGQVNFLNAEEAAKATATNNAVLGRPWELWKRQALARP
jgi:HCOMODA/2-hydroxy-3-carboxy-muconic semialdehyde decarboxylase